MSENFYPVSDEKLGELRKEGIFARSGDLSSFFLLLSFTLSAYHFFSNYLEQFTTLFQRAALSGQGYLTLGALFFKLLVDSSIIFLIPLSAVAIFSVLLQSKFLISFGFIRMRFEKLFSGFSKLRDNYKRELIVLAFSLIKSLICLYVLYFFLSELIGVEILEYSFMQLIITTENLLTSCVAAQVILTKLLFVMLLLMFIIAVFSTLFSVIHFRKIHAMSKQEYMAELD